jgi:hypothetical protein
MHRDLENLMVLVVLIFLCSVAPVAAENPRPSATSVGTMPRLRVGLLYWPSEPVYRAYDFASSIERCLIKTMAQKIPEVIIISHRRLRDGLFPYMEPETQPKSEKEFAEFLQQTQVHERLVELGLQYLIAYTGKQKMGDEKGLVLCGAGPGGGGCLGFAWVGEQTELQAALWELGTPGPLGKRSAAARGNTYWPAVLLPIPIPARTKSEACRELASKIGEFILRNEMGKTRK